MESAPLFEDVAHGPVGGSAHWVTTSDGNRLRIGYWPGGQKGTILLFPGRTEYVEKYGPAASDFLTRGFSTLTIDWRGQGLSDRATDDPNMGHVDDFDEFQTDIDAMLTAAQMLNCPRPYYLVAHSMGGCIGLRALHNRLDVNAVAFTGPMWGIQMEPIMRPLAGPMTKILNKFGQGKTYAPTTKGPTYVNAVPFQDNMLTTDPQMWAFMKAQADKYPELTLAGPSVNWLGSALRECNSLQAMAPPDIPALCYYGSRERIVDPDAIKTIMGKWENGLLHEVHDCEHEVMMEKPAQRAVFFDAAAELFVKQG